MVRPAGLDDISAVRSLLAELGYTPDAQSFATTYRALLDDTNVHLVIADGADGTPVGLLTARAHLALRLATPMVTIEELVVAERARGTSIGSQLLTTAVDWARARGAARVELETRRTRESYARGFYAQRGFVEAPAAVFRLSLLEPR